MHHRPNGSIREIHRPDETLVQAELIELFVGHEVVVAEELAGLDLVELVVARHDGDDGLALAVDEREGLARSVFRESEELRDRFDGSQPRGLDLLKHALARALAHRNRCRSRLIVGREATVTPDERASPASASAMYSMEESPPISPESAATGSALSPQRSQ